MTNCMFENGFLKSVGADLRVCPKMNCRCVEANGKDDIQRQKQRVQSYLGLLGKF